MAKSKVTQSSEMFDQTDIWMDSFSVAHHQYGLENGSVGVTTSPTWVSDMFCEEVEAQTPVIQALCEKHPDYNEQEILWAWTMQMGRERSRIMLPVWENGAPKRGRFSIQTLVYDYRSTERMVEMALEIDSLGPNMQVKLPSTAAGIRAMEEATYRGVSVMATLCYSVSQAIAAAEAIEHGIQRRLEEGLPVDMLNPVCAVLLGMQEDWLMRYAQKENICIHPDAFNWAGAAICKKTYGIFKERGYRTRVLTAYYRTLLNWSEFIGGDVIMTIPYVWQKFFAESDIEIKDYMSVPVDEKMIRQLRRLPPFVTAYDEGMLPVDDFDSFGPVILTLRRFTEVYEKAVLKVRDIMLPDPLA